jgi:hypothetical protein
MVWRARRVRRPFSHRQLTVKRRHLLGRAHRVIEQGALRPRTGDISPAVELVLLVGLQLDYRLVGQWIAVVVGASRKHVEHRLNREVIVAFRDANRLMAAVVLSSTLHQMLPTSCSLATLGVTPAPSVRTTADKRTFENCIIRASSSWTRIFRADPRRGYGRLSTECRKLCSAQAQGRMSADSWPQLRRRTTIGNPPRGASVRRCCGQTTCPGATVKSNAVVIADSASIASCCANAAPMQMRGPAPNGK